MQVIYLGIHPSLYLNSTWHEWWVKWAKVRWLFRAEVNFLAFPPTLSDASCYFLRLDLTFDLWVAFMDFSLDKLPPSAFLLNHTHLPSFVSSFLCSVLRWGTGKVPSQYTSSLPRILMAMRCLSKNTGTISFILMLKQHDDLHRVWKNNIEWSISCKCHV